MLQSVTNNEQNCREKVLILTSARNPLENGSSIVGNQNARFNKAMLTCRPISYYTVIG